MGGGPLSSGWLWVRLASGARPGPVSVPDADALPEPPTDAERVLYVDPGSRLMLHGPMAIGLVLMAGLLGFSLFHAITLPLVPWLAVSCAYWLAANVVILSFRRFDLAAHGALVASSRRWPAPSVDVFLPSCGEPVAMLENTFNAVAALTHDGPLNVFCMDDAASPEVEALARSFGFAYLARPNQREMAKAGNIRYAYERTSSEFIAIFDADFCPRPDFLAELLPYALSDPTIGIVQSPQFFRIGRGRNWLQNGSASQLESFYRVFLPSREAHRTAICVGTNAIYRRAALELTDGPALVPFSEDVHTGFDLLGVGFRTRYVPLILAAGLCPETVRSLVAQQYRWCTGSLLLLFSGKFWRARLGPRERLGYLAGFSYYLYSSLNVLLTPLPALAMIWIYPHRFGWWSSLLLIPIAHQVVSFFGYGHRTPNGLSGMRSARIFGWAHLLALRDVIRRRTLVWTPTAGTVPGRAVSDRRALRLAASAYGSLCGAGMLAGVLFHQRGVPLSFTWPIAAFGAINLLTSLAILVPLRSGPAPRRRRGLGVPVLTPGLLRAARGAPAPAPPRRAPWEG